MKGHSDRCQCEGFRAEVKAELEAWKRSDRLNLDGRLEAEARVTELEAENEQLRDRLGTARSGEHMHGVDVCSYCAEGDIAQQRVPKLEAMLEKAVWLHEETIQGERVFSFKVGSEGHNVAQWTDGDGVASDNVFCERPALKYAVTTTPLQRCLRMVLEMVHWPVLCAMLVGPGDGEFKTAYDQGEVEIDDD